MSRLVEVGELRPGDRFALPNGSVYEVVDRPDPVQLPQGRLWCAHRPDPLAFEPSVVGFAPTQRVQLLDGDDLEPHVDHEGYVAALFRREMDRRHAANMRAVGERERRAAAEEHRRVQAARPWWKRLFP